MSVCYIGLVLYCARKSVVRPAALCRVACCCPGGLGLAVQCARHATGAGPATGHGTRARIRVRALLRDAAARDGREEAGRRRHTVGSRRRAGVLGVLACGVKDMSLTAVEGWLAPPRSVMDGVHSTWGDTMRRAWLRVYLTWGVLWYYGIVDL